MDVDEQSTSVQSTTDERSPTERNGIDPSGTERKGTERNGTERSGVESMSTERSGMEASGDEVRSMEVSGTERNGIDDNGTPARLSAKQVHVVRGRWVVRVDTEVALTIEVEAGEFIAPGLQARRWHSYRRRGAAPSARGCRPGR